jgi:hypothetical protein
MLHSEDLFIYFAARLTSELLLAYISCLFMLHSEHLIIYIFASQVSFFPVKAHISGLFLLHPDISRAYYST